VIFLICFYCQIDIPHLPPGSYKIWGTVDIEEEEDKSDEDLSDEEKQNDEQKDSQEPGSEDKDDDKSDNNNNDKNDSNDDEDDEDDEDDDMNDDDEDNDENDNNDDSNDTNEQNDDENAKKKVNVKRTGKFAKNKKLGHSRKSSTYSKKYENHKTKKEKIKRQAKKYESHKIKKEKIKRQMFARNVREKLRARKNERNHIKRVHREKLKKTLEMTTPQISTEEIIVEDNDVMKQYIDYISKVARAIAKTRGVEVSEEHMNKDIQDMIDFQVKLIDVSIILLCQTTKGMCVYSPNNKFQITMDSSEEKELSLNDLQKWYNKKKPKSSKSAVRHLLI